MFVWSELKIIQVWFGVGVIVCVGVLVFVGVIVFVVVIRSIILPVSMAGKVDGYLHSDSSWWDGLFNTAGY